MREVIIQDYDKNWSTLYLQESKLWEEILLGNLINIFHIGSTAVNGLCAKPTIDILIEVFDINAIDNLCITDYIGFGEHGITGRRYFVKEENGKHLYHVHIFEIGDPEIKKHLVFRNYLRDNNSIRNDYASLKQRIITTTSSIDEYQDLKAKFIEECTAEALEIYQNHYPTIRKKYKLIAKNEAVEIIEKAHFGTLAITNDFPYAIGINHVVYRDRIYFHTGLQGYKLNGIDKQCCFTVINDLGLKEVATTNNYESVMVFGKLVQANEEKYEVLKKLMQDLAPSQPMMTKESAEKIPLNILSIEIDCMYGKRHVK